MTASIVLRPNAYPLVTEDVHADCSPTAECHPLLLGGASSQDCCHYANRSSHNLIVGRLLKTQLCTPHRARPRAHPPLPFQQETP